MTKLILLTKQIIRFIKKFINKIVTWFLSIAVLILFIILFEIPIPFLASFVNNFLAYNYPTYFTQNNYIKLNEVTFGWNEAINRPVVLVKNLVYVTEDTSIVVNKVGFYFSISDLIKYKKATLTKLYVSGVSLDFSQKEQSKEQDVLEELTMFLENNPFNVINKAINNNDFLKKVNQIVVSNVNILSAINNSDFLFTVEDINLIINNNYNFNINTAISVNNVVLLKNLNLKGSLFNNNSLVINADFKNIEFVELQSFLGAFKNDKMQQLLNNVVINNASLSGGFKLEYFKKLNSISGSIYTNNASVFVNSLNDNININSIKLTYKYLDTDGLFNIDNMDIIFDKLTINNDYLQQPIDITDIKYNSVFNTANNSFTSNLIISTKNINSKILAKLKASIGNDIVNFNTTINVFKVPYNVVLQNWPVNLEKVKEWLESNINKVTINSVSFDLVGSIINNNLSIKNYELKANFLDADVTYIDTMPNANAKEVNLTYKNNEVELDIINGSTAKLDIEFGKVKFFNLLGSKASSYNLGILLDLNVKGDINKALSLINNEPLNLVTKSGIKAENIFGNFDGTVFFVYNSNTNMLNSLSVNASIHNAQYNDLLFNNNLNEINAKLSVDLTQINLLGSAKYLSSKVDFNFSGFFNDPNMEYIVNTSFVEIDKADLQYLDILPKMLLDDISNFSNIDLTYTNYINNNSTLSFVANLTNADVKIQSLNYFKSKGHNLNVSGMVTFLNNQNDIKISNLSLLGQGINVQLDILLKDNNNILVNIYNAFIEKNSNFKGLIALENKNLDIDLIGENINLSYFINNKGIAPKPVKTSVIEDLFNNTDTFKNTSVNNNINIDSFNVKAVLSKIIINESTINDFNLKLHINQSKLKELSFSGFFNHKQKSNVNFIPLDNRLLFDIYNAGYMLETFLITKDINNGELRGDVILNQEQEDLYLNGQLLMHDFSSGIAFANASLKFDGGKNLLNISQLVLNGNVMGGTLQGNLKNYKTLYLQGDLTLIWTTLSALNNLPVIRQIRNALKLEDLSGLAKISININGDLGNLKYRIFTDTKK